MITVRRAKVEDKPAIFNFIQNAYTGRWQYKIPDRWNWQYVENPFISSKELPIWIAINSDGEVVGQSCAMMEPLKLGSTVRSMAWGVDLIVDPQYRGQGLGSELKKANDESHDIFMSLTMADRTQRINTELGFASIQPVPTYLRVNQWKPEAATQLVINRAIPRGAIIKKGLVNVSNFLKLDPRFAARLYRERTEKDAHLAALVDPEISISQIERFTDEFDMLWEEVSPNFHALVKRDHIYLNWKFVNQPHVKHIKWIARKNGSLRGYIIVRKAEPPEPNVGIIIDMFVPPAERSILTALVSAVVDYFSREKVRSILSATSVKEYQDLLAEFGFKKVEEDIPMVHFKRPDSDSEISLQPGKWFLSKGDEDWDQYPLATDIPYY